MVKTTWIPILLTIAAMPGKGAPKHDADVAVYLHRGSENPTVIASAQGEARRMLASVGISIAWELGAPRNDGRAEVIEAVLREQPDEKFRPGSLAFATLGVDAGTRIEILYNRIRAGRRDDMVAPVLAHVLVHEITHVLEGVARHSESGVMKANWEMADYRLMRFAPLPFAEEDIRLIHAWSAHRNLPLQARVR